MKVTLQKYIPKTGKMKLNTFIHASFPQQTKL